MRKLSSFTFTTLNGFSQSPTGDTSWHKHGEEEGQYAAEGAQSQSTLLFGRTTYEMMAGFWPTPAALAFNPEVAKGMNESEKVVFSKTLKKATWQNTKLVKDNMIEEVRKMKQMPGNAMTILGSGSILTPLAEAGLIDEFQIMIDPVVLGSGTSFLQGISCQLDLKLTHSRVFKSGVVLVCYRPA